MSKWWQQQGGQACGARTKPRTSCSLAARIGQPKQARVSGGGGEPNSWGCRDRRWAPDQMIGADQRPFATQTKARRRVVGFAELAEPAQGVAQVGLICTDPKKVQKLAARAGPQAGLPMPRLLTGGFLGGRASALQVALQFIGSTPTLPRCSQWPGASARRCRGACLPVGAL